MANVEKQKLKLDRMVEALAREQAKLLLAEREEQRKRRRAELKQREEERRADAHRKIGLGGLVIAAGSDGWDPAEIVGVLLVMGERMSATDGLREKLRERGIAHLEARAAAREVARS
ncbi:conjugal transfer protein TraD [Stenotrophomonas maltophilia]|uniref:conjugal transfer protein TraD n=1 Tax=Stenotrophomonas maltophilia TaxID=40324 RepID=UPI0021C967AB|nr:conjugal transfer protein TraD [Stenotrophomonas maltophilia]EKT4083264.1 conjugal transfer protein TraD [Stenotrophomonas maltophilia]EKT4086022.1 conjugal transfer protein TraD [Stenotrophomonas maltophilia]MCU1169458.1 conjugal transfer protein TraD [Stenotrophomonas maltophilia]